MTSGRDNNRMTRAFRVAAWLMALAIVVVSVVPPSSRPVISTSHDLEHFLIFLAAGGSFGMGYPAKFWTLISSLAIFTAAVEVVQLWVPGRHARVSDFVVDAAAACIGVAVSCVIIQGVKRFGAQ